MSEGKFDFLPVPVDDTPMIVALFNDALTHLKFVELIRRNGDDIFQETELPFDTSLLYIEPRENYPVAEQIRTAEGALHIWPTPVSVKHHLTQQWFTIYDSDNRKLIPGKYKYPTYYLEPRSRDAIGILRATMFTRPLRHSLFTKPSRIPQFVAESLKRDAIAMNQSCSISLEDITKDTKAMITPCFHIFGQPHLEQWLERHSSCPLCKVSISRDYCLSV